MSSKSWSQRHRDRLKARDAEPKGATIRRLKSIWVWASVRDKDEGIMSYQTEHGPMPLLGIDPAHLPAMKQAARVIVSASAEPAKLLRLDVAATVEEIQPDPSHPLYRSSAVKKTEGPLDRGIGEDMLPPREGMTPGSLGVTTGGGMVVIVTPQGEKFHFSPGSAVKFAHSILQEAGPLLVGPDREADDA